MAGLNETPNANRTRISFFGLRNAGKSTLVNAFTSQEIAIVSDIAGTTTDPVSKAMEILPLGPCLITDTAGLDDEGALGELRVAKSLAVLATTDIAVWVCSPGSPKENIAKERFLLACKERDVQVFEYHRGESVDELKKKIASSSTAAQTPPLLEGLAKRGDRIVCVCPIDESAPKGRLILPQVELIRECLDIGAIATVCQPAELESVLTPGALVVTDSQAFARVKEILLNHQDVRLTSFSVLFARQKGDLAEYTKGLDAVSSLNDGDKVLIAEGCTHHRQCNDIGTVKIPKALAKLSGRKLEFLFSSGGAFDANGVKLIVHCGACMLTRREVLRRIGLAQSNNTPITNYGMLLACASGMKLKKGTTEVAVG